MGGAAGTDAMAAGGMGGAAAAPDADVPDNASPPPDSMTAADAGSPPDAGGTTAQARCPAGPFEAPRPGPAQDICPGFQPRHNWNEGPTWHAGSKSFYFSNFAVGAAGPGDMIRYEPATNRCEVFITGNACNGLTVDRDGNILGACHGPRALMKYEVATRKATVVLEMVEGRRLDSPNDVVTHSNGTIYFSNATYELAGRPQGLGPALLRVDPAGAVQVIVRGALNPLGLSPDEKRLYAMGGWWDLDAAGVPVRKAGNFTLGGDGIAVDCAGNVYIQSGAIISPQNQQVGRFPGGTNMAFGGEDGKTLLVVRGREMQVVRMNLPGLP